MQQSRSWHIALSVTVCMQCTQKFILYALYSGHSSLARLFSSSVPVHYDRALDIDPRVPELKKKVESFAGGFQMPGFDVKAIDHKVGQANGFANGHPDIETDGQDHSNPVLNPVPC